MKNKGPTIQQGPTRPASRFTDIQKKACLLLGALLHSVGVLRKLKQQRASQKENGWVKKCPQRLRRVLLHVLANAIKVLPAAPKVGVVIAAAVSLHLHSVLLTRMVRRVVLMWTASSKRYARGSRCGTWLTNLSPVGSGNKYASSLWTTGRTSNLGSRLKRISIHISVISVAGRNVL
ncbi:uncharacterized protein LOC143818215 [Ranitomeya variabilis]|uniref:uncharacterized protein LOC143818215 n=1 Tax=Ranitomeya variabilis TaxID=490064 RepID=UPI0040559FED